MTIQQFLDAHQVQMNLRIISDTQEQPVVQVSDEMVALPQPKTTLSWEAHLFCTGSTGSRHSLVLRMPVGHNEDGTTLVPTSLEVVRHLHNLVRHFNLGEKGFGPTLFERVDWLARYLGKPLEEVTREDVEADRNFQIAVGAARMLIEWLGWGNFVRFCRDTQDDPAEVGIPDVDVLKFASDSGVGPLQVGG